MEFAEHWRRRQACERCRHHKVRCEYENLDAQKCIRCEKTNSECVIKDRGSKKRDGPEPELASRRARKTETRQSLPRPLPRDPNASPLAAAVDQNLYTRLEASQFYSVYLQNVENQLPVTICPGDVWELDKHYPSLALAIVTSAALSTCALKSTERFAAVERLAKTGQDEKNSISVDTHSALLVLCSYLLQFGDPGVLRLSLLHGSMCVLKARLGYKTALCPQREGTLIFTKENAAFARLYEYTAAVFLTSLLSKAYMGLYDIGALYISLDSLVVPEHAHYLAKIFSETYLTINLVRNSTSWQEAVTICQQGLQQLTMVQSTVPKFSIYAIACRIKLVKSAVVWMVGALSAAQLPACVSLIYEAIAATEAYLKFFKGLNMTVTMVQPIWVFLMEDILIALWILRFYSFAGELDIDVPADQFFTAVNAKWPEFLMSGFIGRQTYVSHVVATDTLSLKIGVYNPSTGQVSGAGSSTTFCVYSMGPGGKLELEAPITAATLCEVMRVESYPVGNEPIPALTPRTPEDLFQAIKYVLRQYSF